MSDEDAAALYEPAGSAGMLPVISAKPFESVVACPSEIGPRLSVTGEFAGKLYIVAVYCELGYAVEGVVNVKPRESGFGMETKIAFDWENGWDVLYSRATEYDPDDVIAAARDADTEKEPLDETGTSGFVVFVELTVMLSATMDAREGKPYP